MEELASFRVTVRKKIPFLTSFLFYLLAGCLVVLFLLSIVMAPADKQSDEMKTAYFILAVPDSIKRLFSISIISITVILPLYVVARVYKKAILSFSDDVITITGQRMNILIPINTINTVYCMDVLNNDGFPKGKLIIYFTQKNNKSVRLKLEDYSESDDFMSHLITYEKINFKFFDFAFDPSNGNEDY